MIAEAQIGINELQIDDIQNAKYEIAKHMYCWLRRRGRIGKIRN